MLKLAFVLFLVSVVLFFFIKDAQRNFNINIFFASIVACLQLLLLLFIFASLTFVLQTILPSILAGNRLFSWLILAINLIIGTYILKRVNLYLKRKLTNVSRNSN